MGDMQINTSASKGVSVTTTAAAPTSAAGFAGYLAQAASLSNAGASFKAGRMALNLNSQGQPSTVVYYDASGREMNRGAFAPEQILANMQQFGIAKSDLTQLASTLDAAGVKYKPGEMYAGVAGAGINLDDLAGGGLGTTYDWTQDANVEQKGVYAKAQIAANGALAAQLGVSKVLSTVTGAQTVGSASGVAPSPQPTAASTEGSTRAPRSSGARHHHSSMLLAQTAASDTSEGSAQIVEGRRSYAASPR